MVSADAFIEIPGESRVCLSSPRSGVAALLIHTEDLENADLTATKVSTREVFPESLADKLGLEKGIKSTARITAAHIDQIRRQGCLTDFELPFPSYYHDQ